MKTTCCDDTTGQKTAPKKHVCPVNGKRYHHVSLRTVLQHLRRPWTLTLKEQGYYFCTDPECEVVYFGENDSVYKYGDLRTNAWQKSKQPDDVVCHCFGVAWREAESDASIKQFVIDQTGKSRCACEVQNPSGRCCLKDFPG